MLSGYDKTKVGEQTITVTYEDKKATFKVTVRELEITITNDNYQSLEINNTKYIVADKGTTAEALLGNMKLNSTDYNLVIKNSNSEIVADSDKLKTNQTIELDESNQNFNAVVVIKGDLNSDGIVDLKDLVKLNNYRISKEKTEKQWTSAEKIAFKALKGTEITDENIAQVTFRDIASLNNYRIRK